ncbi:uncharacterized protein LOC110248432 [Exaiptasia diaphana]|uniref:Uncharacterized protein n=1 Tax=Exaiptasia diaphana TaxID=2652724 RepID=A0A913XVU5_EXADI|nr:uncharacterized protein LOC110248432 [Exaiptasia diaphana]KXJ24376.1 hypothetical protein AC249_AIPGENE22660 [Exaiptasia diaphana]
MYTSSMSKKAPFDGNSPYNWRPLPCKGTRKRNPDEDFILRGNATSMRHKDTGYRTNSAMTIRPGSVTMRPSSSQSVRFTDYETTAQGYDPQDLAIDLSDFDDEPCEELTRLKDDNANLLSSTAKSDWFLNPVHRMKSPPINLDKLGQSNPLEASVLKSTSQGNITSDFNEDIRNTSIKSFDMSLFRNAEDEMLASRTLSGLSTPYREELARLKVERLKLEEDRLLKTKCTEELERIRGPKPRWYELKTPDFHKEAQRNNNVLSLSGHYNEIMEYRNRLLATLGEDKCPSRQESMHKFYHSKSHNQTI